MRQIRPLYTIAAVIILLLLPGIARAQFAEPFTSDEGYERARSIARDSIGTDAQIIFLNSSGGTLSSIKAEYEVEEGTAFYWLYTFYSPSARKLMEIGVAKPIGLGFMTQGRSVSPPATLRPIDTARLDIGGAYAASDKLYARLQTDFEFNSYRSAHPGANPNLVTLGNVDLDSLPLEIEFDTRQSIWTLIWGGSTDSTLLCFVGARTGDVQCGQIDVTSAVPALRPGDVTVSLTVAPNPANGRTRVTIDIPNGASLRDGAKILLYDERGEVALDITESCAANGYQWGEFDAGRLPSGTYFLHAAGSNWSGIVGVVVEK